MAPWLPMQVSCLVSKLTDTHLDDEYEALMSLFSLESAGEDVCYG